MRARQVCHVPFLLSTQVSPNKSHLISSKPEDGEPARLGAPRSWPWPQFSPVIQAWADASHCSSHCQKCLSPISHRDLPTFCLSWGQNYNPSDPEMVMMIQANLQGEVRGRYLTLKSRYLPNSFGWTERDESETRKSASGTKGGDTSSTCKKHRLTMRRKDPTRRDGHVGRSKG